MASTCTEITCDDGCAIALPAPKFNRCTPEGAFGQISEVFITNVDYPLTDENSAAEWLGRIGMADDNPAKIWRLWVIGDLPASESQEVEMSHDRVISGPEQFSLNLRIDEVNQENYEFARGFDCPRRVKLWYMAYGGDAYGGPQGIDVIMKWKHVIPEGTNDLQTLVSTPKWKSSTKPCRFMHPLAGDETGIES